MLALAVVAPAVLVAAVAAPGARADDGLVPSAAVTSVHDAAHVVVTAVAAGSDVHDSVIVSAGPATSLPAGTPPPTGPVTVEWFANAACAGPAAATSAPIALAGGSADATAFTQRTLASGAYAFRASYPGDAVYAPSVGQCEPLSVVDANVQIGPGATSPVGGTQTITAHVNVSAGAAGFVPAPDGTPIAFSIVSGPGTFAPAGSCVTAGGTGSCQVAIASPTPGTTLVAAQVATQVAGVPLTRSTDGSGTNSGPAATLWVDDAVGSEIHGEGHVPVTSVPEGSVVHDKAFVLAAAGTPAQVAGPTGVVVFHRYSNADCTGTPADETVALGVDGTAESSALPIAVDVSYRVDYPGDALYPPRSGACEVVTVVHPTPPTPLPVLRPQPSPAIAISMSPPSQTVAAGGTARWTIVVTNTGNGALTNVRVTDLPAPACSRTSADVPALASILPGASVTLTCSRPGVTAGFTNVATVAGKTATGEQATASAAAVVKVQPLTPPPKPKPPQPRPAAVEIVMKPKQQEVLPGRATRFEIRVENSGGTWLHAVTVRDVWAPRCNRRLGAMRARTARTYDCTGPKGVPFLNRATVVGVSPAGKKVHATDAAVGVGVFLPPVISVPSIDVAVDPGSETVYVQGGRSRITRGGPARFTITVRNSGDLRLRDVTVTDPRSPACNRRLGAMAPGRSITYTCSRADVRAPYANAVHVVGTSEDGRVKAEDGALVTLAFLRPSTHPLAIEFLNRAIQFLDTRIVRRTDPKTKKQVRATVYGAARFEIRLTNIGTSPLAGVRVRDARSPGCNRDVGLLAPGAWLHYRCSRQDVRARFRNVAIASGRLPNGDRVTGRDAAVVYVRRPERGGRPST